MKNESSSTVFPTWIDDTLIHPFVQTKSWNDASLYPFFPHHIHSNSKIYNLSSKYIDNFTTLHSLSKLPSSFTWWCWTVCWRSNASTLIFVKCSTFSPHLVLSFFHSRYAVTFYFYSICISLVYVHINHLDIFFGEVPF